MRHKHLVQLMWPNSTALLAALPYPALLISQDARVRAINAAARGLFSIDAVGRHYLAVLRQPQVSRAVEDVLEGADRAEAKFTERGQGVDTRWQMNASLLKDLPEAENTRAVLVTFQDVTAVDTASQMRRDFVANVSHELRTPLTAILGFIETLRGAAKTDEVARARFLAIMEREAQRMLHLVDGLLSLSRVENNERVRPKGDVVVATLLEDVVTSLEPIAASYGSQIEIVMPEPIPNLRGDAEQLGQVLRNLIQNGLKYGHPHSTVRVHVSGPNYEETLRTQGVRIAVQDQGEGLAAHHIPRLTERFYRADDHRTRESGGSGLGLAIVKHIINRHRGKLLIESGLGEGSCFTVILPL